MKKVLILLLFCCVIFLFCPIFETYGLSEEEYLKNQYREVKTIREKYNLKGEGVSIALLDSGISKKKNQITIKGGISFKETDNYVDLNGHGTHIAGIINSIAPKADIYAVKVLDKKLSGSYDDLIKGIQWAIANNVDIISMSLGGDKKSESLHKAIKEAHQKGIVVISSVGNNGYSVNDTVTYPAKYDEVLGVGALGKNKKKWFRTSRGNGIDFLAPGEEILSNSLNGKYIKRSGTSISAAYATGVVALMIEQNKSLSNDEIKNILSQTAIPLGSKYEYGHGVLDINNALDQSNKIRWFKNLKTGGIVFGFLTLVTCFFFIRKSRNRKVLLERK
ncbi:hypothetical protein EI976_05030 [Bacillus licheniformis]|uniref:S8 family peptidase n=1 Tax=Bacillus licheniformis TaxID=1402 RepID=UPI000305174E|nr:S8 family peptidase [Bacillus licheniformis]KAA0813138.1 hypothetical protein EI978_08280 [Bacillus licheniformis]KAA0821327.1 hypothetical protein EI973_19290 [Bacillus licheniformis]KAA0826413.1 hypothetical protein EI976_05030 [Bacillus licheniformis]MBU8781516.1 S8 family peptidase [Bacillus licheniformis]MBU8799539.1 S8 family peptidase [Bacillus licheniformis]